MTSKTQLRDNKKEKNTKFMQTVTLQQWDVIAKLAEEYSMTVQEYIRFIIIPKYVRASPNPLKYSERVRKGWETRRLNKKNADHAESSYIPPPPWETQSEPKEGDQS